MKKYIKDNLYVRVGYTKKNEQLEDIKIKDEDLIEGIEVSVIDSFILNNYKLSGRKLVLKTPFGYIPVENINNSKDIILDKCLEDKTFYLKKYDDRIDEEYNDDVKKLLLRLK